jgi:hypothetical protein
MHVFSFTSRNANSQFRDCLIIFLGLGEPDAGAIDDTYAHWTRSNVPPSVSLILGRSDRMREFHDELNGVNGKYQKLDRLYKHGDVILAGFDYTGRVMAIGRELTAGADLGTLFKDAIHDFLQQQIEYGDIVIPAPPGIYFDKLSSRFSSHFIRAEALLQSTTFIELLALALLEPFNEWRANLLSKQSDTIDIYLDSMSIWPVAEKIAQLHRVGNAVESFYRIESFKSYDGLDKWFPVPRPAFVLISATTSGGLADKVSKKLGRSNAEIWTLLTLKSKSQHAEAGTRVKCLYEIPRKLKGKPSLSGLREDFQTDMSSIPPGVETISIVGERFLSQPAKPKRVRLIHRALTDTTKTTLELLARKNVVKAARGRYDGQTRWSISFDFDILMKAVIEPDEVGQDSLLRNWIRNYSSPSPVAVIYPSAQGPSATSVTAASKKLADATKNILLEFNPAAKVAVITSDDLSKKELDIGFSLSNSSIIVVAPVVGNGFIFKQISALLRHKQPKGPRLFLALAVLPESDTHLTQLKQDISANYDDRKYEFKYNFAVPIGRLDDAVQWKREISVLHELEEQLSNAAVVADSLISRTALLDKFEVLDDKAVFLPAPDLQPLYLSTGFFLWPGSVNIEGGHHAGAVLLSIAALLQAARTSNSKNDDTSLRSGLFQHSLICPEMFTRFNDAVIQAAILRAAYPAELNYSVSPEISYDMERLLLKWIQYYDQPAGAAVGEFLLAIAVGKLKLRPDGLEKVVEAAGTLPGWIGMLGRIAGARTIVKV